MFTKPVIHFQKVKTYLTRTTYLVHAKNLTNPTGYLRLSKVINLP